MAEKDPKETPANAGGGNENQEPKLEFTPQQQEWVNSKINEVFGKGFDKAKGEFESQLTTATAQLTALQTEIAELKKKPAKQTPKDDSGADDKAAQQVAQLQAQIDELKGNYNTVKSERDTLKQTMESSRTESRRSQFESSFNEVVGEAEITFFNNKQVLRDLEDAKVLRHEEDGSITVMNPKSGQPRLNAEMEAFPLKDLLAEYARKNPHMVRTEVDGGTGSTPSKRHTTRSESKSVKDMSTDEFEAFHQKVLSGAARR